MPLTSLREFLDNNNIKYQVIFHSKAYTAQEIANLAHIPGQELAKTVILTLDGHLAMAVLPASAHVDVAAIRVIAGVENARLASELEFKDRFPGCETGAMPPFGNLYDMAVFVDEELAKDKEIAFNAGSHTELVRMAFHDFVHLVNPRVTRFSTRKVRAFDAGEDRLW